MVTTGAMPVVPFLLRAACEHADALGWYLAPGRTRRGDKNRGPVECVPPEAEPTSRRQADARIGRKVRARLRRLLRPSFSLQVHFTSTGSTPTGSLRPG